MLHFPISSSPTKGCKFKRKAGYYNFGSCNSVRIPSLDKDKQKQKKETLQRWLSEENTKLLQAKAQNTALTNFTVLTAIHQRFSPQKGLNKIQWCIRLFKVNCNRTKPRNIIALTARRQISKHCLQ